MATDQHEALTRAYIDEVFNGHRVDALEKYWDDDLTSHWLGMETIHGLPAWRTAMEGFFAAFPDAAYTLDDMFFARRPRRLARPLAGDPAGRMARDRRVRPQRDVDRHHHRPLRQRQADRGLGRAGPAPPLPAARAHSDRIVSGGRSCVPGLDRWPSPTPLSHFRWERGVVPTPTFLLRIRSVHAMGRG